MNVLVGGVTMSRLGTNEYQHVIAFVLVRDVKKLLQETTSIPCCNFAIRNSRKKSIWEPNCAYEDWLLRQRRLQILEPLVGQMDQADTECQRAEAQQKLADSQNDPNNETCIIVRKLRGAVSQADHSKWELNTNEYWMLFEWHTVTYKDPELNEPSLHVWCMFFEILFPNPKVFQIQPPRKWKPCWRNRDVNILRKSRSCRWLLTRLNVLQKRPLGCLLFFSDKALLGSCNETVTIHHWL